MEACDGTNLGCKVCRRIAIEDAIRKSKDITLKGETWKRLALGPATASNLSVYGAPIYSARCA